MSERELEDLCARLEQNAYYRFPSSTETAILIAAVRARGKALEPFAETANVISHAAPDNFCPDFVRFPMSSFRAAKKALEGT